MSSPKMENEGVNVDLNSLNGDLLSAFDKMCVIEPEVFEQIFNPQVTSTPEHPLHIIEMRARRRRFRTAPYSSSCPTKARKSLDF